jgi:hypothetical protein
MVRYPEGLRVIFAAPDFGAGGMVVLILCGVGLAVLGVSIAAITRGRVLLCRPPPARRWSGVVLILAGLLLPVCCCMSPSVLFRLHHDTPPLGRYPNGVINEGMSPEEVRTLLGSPHQIDDRDPQRVTSLYWLDAIELGWFMVTFDADGKVDHTGGS